MSKKGWIWFIMMIAICGLLMNHTACSKRQVVSDIDITGPDAAERARLEAEKRAREEARRLREAEEQRRLRQSDALRARDQASRRNEEMRMREEMSARERFQNADIYFEYNESTLRWDSQEELKLKAEWLRNHPEYTTLIEGHCDERGSEEYNLALGERRAETVKSYLIDLGVSEMRMRTVSYGEEQPLDKTNNEEAWAKNRRAHFVIIE